MRRLVPALFVAASLALAGCTVSPPNSVDLAAFATGLGAAVASANAQAFGSESFVTGVAAGHTASGEADAESSSADAATQAIAAAFADSLTGTAVASWDEHAESLGDDADALGEDGPLTRIAVSVESARVTASTAEQTTIETDVSIVRALNSGVDWEEVVPYEATVDNSTGKVITLIVHDNP